MNERDYAEDGTKDAQFYLLTLNVYSIKFWNNKN